MWKDSVRKKAPPPPPRRGRIYAWTALPLLLGLGLAGFALEDGAFPAFARVAFFIVGILGALAYALGRRRRR